MSYGNLIIFNAIIVISFRHSNIQSNLREHYPNSNLRLVLAEMLAGLVMPATIACIAPPYGAAYIIHSVPGSQANAGI